MLLQGPTSFSDLDSMLGESTKQSGAAARPTDMKRQLDKKPSLLGRLAGNQNLQSLKKVSMSDLQGVVSSKFGQRK